MLSAYFAARFGNAGGGVPNPFEAEAGDISGHYAEHGTLIATSGYLYCLAAILLLVFAAGLTTRFRESAAEDARGWALTGLAGSAVYSVLLLLVGLLQLALVGMARREGAEDSVAALAIVWAMSIVVLVPASVPLLVGFGMAGRRSGQLSGLLTGFALAGALLGLAPPPEVVGPLSPVAASLLFVLSELQPWLLVIWMVGTAFVIRRSLAESEPEQLETVEEAGA